MDKAQALTELASEITKCQKCSLYKTAKCAVPGEGNSDTPVVFIGEAPGYWEDQQGKPFVGPAGQLLNKLLASINLNREQVFICNMLRHRPPNNRDPQEDELEACRVWLDKQLEIINPKIIVTLGRFSMTKFIPDGRITRIHGHSMRVNDRIIMPMFHPAAALRERLVQNQLEEDFLKIPDLLKPKANIIEEEPKEIKTENDNNEQMEMELSS